MVYSEHGVWGNGNDIYQHLETGKGPNIYSLKSVLIHTAGHYKALIRDNRNNWNLCNDSRVRVERDRECYRRYFGGDEYAYMLAYVRCNDDAQIFEITNDASDESVDDEPGDDAQGCDDNNRKRRSDSNYNLRPRKKQRTNG